MSNLLEQASLVMIPSGYKEDVVYSEIPINGAGDLTFTRASNGTRINSAGLVEVCPWNIAQQSETFNVSPWTNYGTGTITANATSAPNGTTTADLFVPNTTNYTHAVEQNIGTTSGVITMSVYAKAAGYNWLVLNSYVGSSKFTYFDLQNGVIGTTASGVTASIENVGNGWFKLICTLTGGAITYFSIISATANNTSSFAGNGTSGTYLWGAQLNIGSTAKPYFPTTDRLNVPRLTYQNGGGGCPSLLLEKQSTNFQTYSQDFTNAAWTKLGQGVGDTSVVTANYAISPDGTQNATRFVCNLNGGTTSSDRSWMIASFTAQATSTISIWIKLNSAGTKTVLLSDSGGGTKTISGTDWQRIDATFVGAGGEFRIGLIGGSTSDTLDCCIWGAQAEAGSYPTSYIPTTSASATRVADECYKTGISSLIGQTQGSVFFDFTVDTISGQTNFPVLWYMKDGGSGERYVQLFPNGNLLYNEYDGVSIIAQITKSGLTVGRHKCAIAYAPNDMTFYVDGVQIGTDTSGTPSGFSTFGFQYYASVYNSQQKVNQTVIFPTRLTNAELASLTTL